VWDDTGVVKQVREEGKGRGRGRGWRVGGWMWVWGGRKLARRDHGCRLAGRWREAGLPKIEIDV